MNYRFRITIGALFIIAGLLLSSDWFLPALRANYSRANAAPSAPVSVAQVNSTSPTAPAQSPPVKLTIATIGFSIALEPGYYDSTSKTWTLRDGAAFYATTSAFPNRSHGITYLYGHNTADVFHPLFRLSTGDMAELVTKDGTRYRYALNEEHDLAPTDDSWLRADPSTPQLVLQTCNGFWDQYRHVFVFNVIREA